METFIRCYQLLPDSVCEEIIAIHQKNDQRTAGKVYGGLVDPTVKRSFDSGYRANDTLPRAFVTCLEHLRNALECYLKEFPDADSCSKFAITESFNVQHYEPSGGYFARHYERHNRQTSLRHLVWMIYLNTVTDGGGTAFPNQDMIVDAVAGRVVIWPSDWTHAHYGIVSPTQDKFIMTGWYSYV